MQGNIWKGWPVAYPPPMRTDCRTIAGRTIDPNRPLTSRLKMLAVL